MSGEVDDNLFDAILFYELGHSIANLLRVDRLLLIGDHLYQLFRESLRKRPRVHLFGAVVNGLQLGKLPRLFNRDDDSPAFRRGHLHSPCASALVFSILILVS